MSNHLTIQNYKQPGKRKN